MDKRGLGTRIQNAEPLMFWHSPMLPQGPEPMTPQGPKHFHKPPFTYQKVKVRAQKVFLETAPEEGGAKRLDFSPHM